MRKKTNQLSLLCPNCSAVLVDGKCPRCGYCDHCGRVRS